MRITGGRWRSRRLRGPKRGMAVRPTPDALRERAFAVLGDRVEGVCMLDLFAGTGAVGLEALSRGAESVVFVERDRLVAGVLRANLADLEDRDDLGQVVVKGAAVAVKDLSRKGRTFGLMWADPPFSRWQVGLDALLAAVEADIVDFDAMICLECPAEALLPSAVGPYRLVRDLRGGASRLAMFAR